LAKARSTSKAEPYRGSRINADWKIAKSQEPSAYRGSTWDGAAIVGDTMSGLKQTLAFRPGEILCCSGFSRDIQTGNSTRE
jgi:hypothetical protein